ncbi:hypothetical protein [Flavobacterium aurantiibacter]|uniref:Lipoprotein n=1 Tax=Flavobacterium aurantiibacter TaxID=2023067 RepID=A0A255ZZQ4_9FLAO|nr:hypothetical protein [Flavobacterium aurantiibacter]OYQ46926.1 hypothetical protein CHX27_03600 [Flavobacterium aurantiibacter]
MKSSLAGFFHFMRIAPIKIFVLSLLLLGCEQRSLKNERRLYVISEQDSLQKNSSIPRPAPPDFQNRFYTDVVFILDSVSDVHLYQTSKIYNLDGESSNDYSFPNFIELKPEHLVTVSSKSFISFFKNNLDVLDNANEYRAKHYYFASETDTIKNQALYDFFEYIKHVPRAPSYFVRMTTEEEKMVLKFKKQHRFYAPKLIPWSSNFLDGNCKPYTDRYKKVESQIRVFRRAKTTFDSDSNASAVNL